MTGVAHPTESPAPAPRNLGLPSAWAGDGGGVPQLIAVRACGAGWRIDGEPLEAILFTSGAAAERAARRLALAIACTGADAKVNVYDASDALVGCIQYYATLAPPGTAALRQYPWAD